VSIDVHFRRHYGVITRQQAGDLGLTDRQIDHRAATGRWIRAHPHVYRLAAVPATWESQLLAAVLASRGVASHRCAAALWRLDPFKAPRIEVTVPHHRRVELEGVLVHRSRQWGRRDETVKRGIACTGIERAILDSGAVVSVKTLERTAESGIRKGQTSWRKLLRCLCRHSAQGRNGCGTLRQLLALRVADGRVTLSDFGLLVAQLLEEHGVDVPVREHPILDPDGNHILQADLAWPDRKKAWELDGLAFHFGRAEVERDRRKRNRAKTHGWNIQEILWSMYTDEPDQLVEMARRFLRS
jgi:hypothetical protein